MPSVPTDVAGLRLLRPPCPRRLAERFAADTPNRGMLESVAAGRNLGLVFADDPLRPEAVVVVSRFGWTYATPAITAEQLRAVTEAMRGGQEVCHVVVPGSPHEAALADADPVVDRIEFTRHDRQADASRLLPAGVTISPTTRELFEQCLWKGEVIADCGTYERFAEMGVGRLAVHEGRPVCEAYGSLVGDTTIEMGIITHPDWRGRGLATATCGALIEAIYARGFRPFWSCDRANEGSARTARRLGFGGERACRFFYYRQR